MQQCGHDTARRPCNTAPRHGQQGPRHGRPKRRGKRRAFTHGLARGESQYKKIISWLGATVCVAIWRSRAAIQRCDTACETVGHACDTARSACGGSWVTIHFLYHDRRGARDTTMCACDTATTRRQCAPRHSPVRAATRRCARDLGVVRAQPVRSLGHVCVHCALDPVLTQCTVLSHCLDHCS